jgi:hypothetical protein
VRTFRKVTIGVCPMKLQLSCDSVQSSLIRKCPVSQPLNVLSFDGTDALQHFTSIEGRLGVCERVGGSGWRLSFDEGEVVDSFAETLHVGSRDLKVNLVAPVMDVGYS